ncbi:hypothetical protein GRF29_106g1720362 [Pseudopithomyces chartarum]|uniref:Mitochondrial carrier protein pet8 n=1 Tax=Pseudopithomyces chartarum TaxID=1892770 RepID=A0AAN6LT74_9PLEO|nr:hypothetical protein GRF29_106g1720362 [Pseudopithomyces chartarum]
MSAFRTVAFRRAPFVAQRAPFSVSALRMSGKETHLHDEGRAAEVEKTKADQLKKQKEGKGHWEEGLASDSESIIKADRAEDPSVSSEQTIKKLQEETAKLAGEKSRT